MEKREPLLAAAASRGGRFLKLPDIDAFRGELKGVRKEYVKETVAQHAYLMIGELETPKRGNFRFANFTPSSMVTVKKEG